MRMRRGDRAFSGAGHRSWNSFHSAIRSTDSVESFNSELIKLKQTYLFSKAYSVLLVMMRPYNCNAVLRRHGNRLCYYYFDATVIVILDHFRLAA